MIPGDQFMKSFLAFVLKIHSESDDLEGDGSETKRIGKNGCPNSGKLLRTTVRPEIALGMSEKSYLLRPVLSVQPSSM